jgi:hypothetical protein
MIRYATDSRQVTIPKSAAPAPTKIAIPSPVAGPVIEIQPGQPLASAKPGPEPLELSGDSAPKTAKQRSANPAKKSRMPGKPKAEATTDAPPLLLDLEV